MLLFNEGKRREKKTFIIDEGGFFFPLSCFFSPLIFDKVISLYYEKKSETTYVHITMKLVLWLLNSYKIYLYNLLFCSPYVFDVCVRICAHMQMSLTFSISLSLHLFVDRTHGRIKESSHEKGYSSFIRARSYGTHTHAHSV